MNRVPQLFPASTIVCIASGPSLTRDDVSFCRGKAPVVVVNDAVQYAPWADVLYACDGKWWERHPETRTFPGLKFSLRSASDRPDVTVLQQSSDRGLESDPSALCTGKNSGYQAINLAVHLGAHRIVLLGYDMQPGPDGRLHFFGAHPWGGSAAPPFALFRSLFESLVTPLTAAGIGIVNCSRSTALTMFPRALLADVLVSPVVA